MNRGARVVSAERFAQGMTFAQYVTYAGSPENLAREAGWWLGHQRRDFSGLLRDWYERGRLDRDAGILTRRPRLSQDGATRTRLRRSPTP